MKIYILRHGETDLNSQGVMQGILDIPLNRNGRELAAVTGRAMRGIRFDGCYTSPLIRAAETAEIILRESGNDIQPVTDARLREINCGDLEGKKLSELGDAGIRFMADPARFPGFPNGETLQDICRRISAGWKGDCADRYLGKLSATLDELERLQKDITVAAEDLRQL